jgi:hypothetical protein
MVYNHSENHVCIGVQISVDSLKKGDTAQKKNIFAFIARIFHRKLPADSIKTHAPNNLSPKTFLGVPGYLHDKGILHTNGDSLARSKLTVFNKYKTLLGDTGKKRPFPVKLHMNATGSGYYSDYQYPTQSAPSNYLRWQVSPTIEVFGIPLKANAFVSTEANVFKNIDAFSIGFDFNRMKDIVNDKLKQSFNERQAIENTLNANQLLKVTEYNQIQKELNDKDYLAKIEAQKKLLDQKPNLDSFGLAQNAKQIQGAESDVKNYEAKLSRFKELESTVQQFNEDEIKRKLRERAENEKSDIGQKLDNMASPYGKYLKFLYAIKSFDIGNCSPIYSELTMNGGLGIKGVNVAISPGKFFLAFTSGKTLPYPVSFGDNTSTDYGSQRRVSAIRVGFGTMDKAIITGTVLQGQDLPTNQNNTGADWPPIAYSNTVASVSGTVNYKNVVTLNAEGAKSLTVPLKNADGNTVVMPSEKVFSDNTSGSSAFSVKATGTVPVLKTRILASWQEFGANFNSYGLAYIPKDIQKYNFRVDQDILHHRVTVSAFIRKQQDDLLQTKQFQTVNLSYGGSATIKWKKLPVVQLSYSPTAQYSFVHAATKDSTLFASNLFTGTATFTRQKGKVTSSTTLVYSSCHSNGFYAYTNRTFSLNQLLAVSKTVSFMASGSYVDAVGLFNFRSVILNASADLNLPKNNGVKSGLYYQEQTNISMKKGAFISFNINISKYASLQVRGDYFLVKDIYNENISVPHFSVLSALMVHW